MRPDPVRIAQEQLRAHQEATGMTFEDPDAPVAPDARSLASAPDEEIRGGYLGGRRG